MSVLYFVLPTFILLEESNIATPSSLLVTNTIRKNTNSVALI
jgi:hypothetical protein